jgi:hypothetical protein
MTHRETGQTAELFQQPLTVSYARRVLFLSYRFSQQNRGLQRSIFRYLHTIRPEWKIPDKDFKVELADSAIKQFTNYVIPKHDVQMHPVNGKHTQSGKRINEQDVYVSVNQEVTSMEQVFNDIEPDNPNSSEGIEWQLGLHLRSAQQLLPSIVSRMLNSDYYFLVEEGGRDRAGIPSTTPQADPWSSYVIDYGIQKYPTGLAEYDQLFSDIRSYIVSPERKTDRAWNDNDAYILPELIDVYNKHHEQKAYLPPSVIVKREHSF